MYLLSPPLEQVGSLSSRTIFLRWRPCNFWILNIISLLCLWSSKTMSSWMEKEHNSYIVPLIEMTSNTQDKLLPALEGATKGSESFSKQKPKNQKSQKVTNLIDRTSLAWAVDAPGARCSRCCAVTKSQPLTADYPSTGHATTDGHRQMGEQKERMSQRWSVYQKSWHMKSPL